MKVNCNLIKDILPLYVKGETSTESNAIIEEHLEECEDCRKVHQILLSDDTIVQSSTIDENFGKSLKKVKSRLIIRILLATILTVSILSVAFLFLFYGVVPTKSSNVEIVPTLTINDNTIYDRYNVDFHLTSKNPKKHLNLRFNSTIPPGKSGLTYLMESVYLQFRVPFDDIGKGDYYYGCSFIELTGEEEMVFHFRDRDVVYNIKELFDEEGLS